MTRLPAPQDTGKWPSLFLTVLVHGLLAAFLFYGIRWQSRPPEVVEVSLVQALPEPRPPVRPPEPAPPPPEPPRPAPPEPPPPPKPEVKPPPPPPKPDIAEPVKKPPKPIDKAKPPEPKKPEPPKPEKKPEPAKPEPPKAEPKKPTREELANKAQEQRTRELLAQEEQQARQAAMLREEERRVAEAQNSALRNRALADYQSKIRAKVRGNIVPPPGLSGNPEAVMFVDQLPDGSVIDVRLKRSSGNTALDQAIERAIRKSSPLPKPDRPELFSRSLELTFRPLED